MSVESATPNFQDSWDPLDEEHSDPGMMVAAQRRELRNILKSYTGYYDIFSELIQNSLDAIDRRFADSTNFRPSIWISIDMQSNTLSVTDNGCGMTQQQFRQFLRPNLSFKQAETSRGNKGVGATYLGYGFNHLEVATRQDDRIYSGILRGGRDWVEDRSESIARPKVESISPSHAPFSDVSCGTSMVVQLTGKNIRPKDLTWIGADTAAKWLQVLRLMTPLGGVYLCGSKAPRVDVFVEVKNTNGEVTNSKFDEVRYLFPEEVTSRTADLREYLVELTKRTQKGVFGPPPKYQSLHGLWGEWTGEQILNGDSPITARLEPNEEELIRELGLKLRVFLAFSTDLWDQVNDKVIGLRQGQRLLRGGLQLCTRNMPQGLPLTIPMTDYIGFQNLAHILVHFENAEPDLGRKGFQPDIVRVAEKLSVSTVTAFRKHYALLRKPGAAKEYSEELKLEQWKQEQIRHEIDFPLRISGRGLFIPTEELCITSMPVVEQDVVALFNQMLSSGLVRGIKLIASSQYKQYDGLFRVKMEKPFEKFVFSPENPLGLDKEQFADHDKLESLVKVLEYKYTLDGLIEEFQGEVKSIEDIGLVVAWEMGEKWAQLFEVVSYLDLDHVHHRKIHGTTHKFTHAVSGSFAFEAIILKDLVNYLVDPANEIRRQKNLSPSE